MTDDRVPALAASDTLLGMLQRGQGAGFLAALSLPSDEVHPHLVGCITCDPRWDCQLDNRSAYYGDLAIAVDLGVEPLERHLRHHDEDELGGLVIPTLGRMAQWGHAGARDVLVEYARYGEACADAVGELATWPDAWAGLDAVLCARFPKDEDLITELALHHRYLGEDPWSTWAASDSRLGAILRTVLREEEEGDRRQAEDDSALPACSTLAEAVAEFAALRSDDPYGWYGRDGRLLRQIESLAQPSDTGQALEWVRCEHPRLRGAALRALSSMVTAAAFPDLVALVDQDAAGRLHPKLRRELLRALESLPAEVTLPTARLWYDGGSAGHVTHASWILKKHATRQDLPRLVMGIERAVVGGDWYRVTAALEAPIPGGVRSPAGRATRSQESHLAVASRQAKPEVASEWCRESTRSWPRTPAKRGLELAGKHARRSRSTSSNGMQRVLCRGEGSGSHVGRRGPMRVMHCPLHGR